MRISIRRRSTLSSLFALLLVLSLSVPASAADPAQLKKSDLTVEQSGRITGTKSATSRLAETDKQLLARDDSAMVNVVIKLDVDSVAVYGGGLPDLSATSPRVTGKSLDSDSAAVRAYTKFIDTRQDAFAAALAKAVPSAKLGVRLETVYGGVAARIPASAVEKVLAIKGVVAVQNDSLEQLLTDSSPAFIDANPVYSSLGGVSNAGKGVIFGGLDSGVWPEHPSFADQGNLPAPPPKADGTPRTCNFGDNPLTPAADPFVCNKKLIGGQPFLATYLSSPARAAAEPFHTARDSNGHGSHTASTAAGNSLATAPVFGVERGPLHGIAPGAYVISYKVCGIQGCFGSDSAAAVAQAIKDGVDVINFSISGGTDPLTDPVELAFLDAYAAGVAVAASAGNEGPGASTANHLSPWVNTVAASTQRREFSSTLTVTGTGGASATFTGASITAGVGPLPIVLSSAAPYSRALCDAPAAPGTFTGKIVACQRGGNARVEKGFNVLQGGAAGMVLYNATLADIETDNHWLPTVHLADGTAFLAFLAANTGEMASFTAGTKQNGLADIMAAFSSRGPAGNFIKPDVTAPGVQILGAHTPFREDILGGPPGEMFQAIAGTSMSSPHVAGASILVLAKHPSWTPGQIKSALMLTAITSVKKEDLTTPADPFDFGSGRIDIAAAVAAPLTLDETAADYALLTGDPLNAIHLNIASVNAPVMPGRVTTTRVVTNTTGKKQKYEASTTSPSGSTIKVSPTKFELKAGKSKTLKITIESDAPLGVQQFGAVKIVAKKGSSVPLGWRMHMPVAFIHTQGNVSLTQSCLPGTIKQGENTVCTVTATNNAFEDATVNLETKTDGHLKILSATGATLHGSHRVNAGGTLLGAKPGVPSIAPGAGPAGFLPLDLFGGTLTVPVGDEDIVNFNVPAFVYNGVTYTQVGVDSNGYAVVGGGTAEDNNCCNLNGIPDPARPNNVLAPFWTDLDGTGATGIRLNVLTDGVNSWLVVEWQVNVFGTNSNRHFQIWIGVDGTQDISFAYDPAALPGDPPGQAFQVGAENDIGQGQGIVGLPTTDLVVTSTAPTPGASLTYSFTARGADRGNGPVVTEMDASTVSGVTIVKTIVVVTRK